MRNANLGDLAMESGELDQAANYLSRALAVRGVPNNRYLAPSLIRSIGVSTVQRGHHELGLELIASSERPYEDFGLTADPGDEVTPSLRKSAVKALGATASKIETRGRVHTLEEAVTFAVATLDHPS